MIIVTSKIWVWMQHSILCTSSVVWYSFSRGWAVLTFVYIPDHSGCTAACVVLLIFAGCRSLKWVIAGWLVVSIKCGIVVRSYAVVALIVEWIATPDSSWVSWGGVLHQS